MIDINRPVRTRHGSEVIGIRVKPECAEEFEGWVLGKSVMVYVEWNLDGFRLCGPQHYGLVNFEPTPFLPD